MKALAILRHFGYENQIEKLKEEMQELLEALKDGDITDIIEESADVSNVLLQFMEYHSIKNPDIYAQYEKAKEEKQQRTIKRIEAGYYEKIKEK